MTLPICGDLGPTATYQQRRWVWVRNPDPTRPGEHHDGRLTVTLQKGLRAGCKCEADTYLVEEVPAVGVIARSFLLVNETDPTQPDCYAVCVGVRPTDSSCSCQAGKCRVFSGCKHIDALTAMLAEGGLDHPFEAAPVSADPTPEEVEAMAESFAWPDVFRDVPTSAHNCPF